MIIIVIAHVSVSSSAHTPGPTGIFFSLSTMLSLTTSKLRPSPIVSPAATSKLCSLSAMLSAAASKL